MLQFNVITSVIFSYVLHNTNLIIVAVINKIKYRLYTYGVVMAEAVQSEYTLHPVSHVVQIPGSYHKGNTAFPMIGQEV